MGSIDPIVEEEADALINPRPSAQVFASLAEREAAHQRLYHDGLCAVASGDLEAACDRFRDAYALLFRTATLQSLVNMKLRMGEAELAAACYTKMLSSGAIISDAERRRAHSKLAEARQLHADVRLILVAPQAALLNSTDERERAHRRLVDRAREANENGDRQEAERLFLEAWPYTFRVATVVSAANMMVHAGGRKLRIAVGVYRGLLRLASPRLLHPLSPDDEALITRKWGEAKAALGELARREYAARTIQRVARGASARGWRHSYRRPRRHPSARREVAQSPNSGGGHGHGGGHGRGSGHGRGGAHGASVSPSGAFMLSTSPTGGAASGLALTASSPSERAAPTDVSDSAMAAANAVVAPLAGRVCDSTAAAGRSSSSASSPLSRAGRVRGVPLLPAALRGFTPRVTPLSSRFRRSHISPMNSHLRSAASAVSSSSSRALHASPPCYASLADHALPSALASSSISPTSTASSSSSPSSDAPAEVRAPPPRIEPRPSRARQCGSAARSHAPIRWSGAPLAGSCALDAPAAVARWAPPSSTPSNGNASWPLRVAWRCGARCCAVVRWPRALFAAPSASHSCVHWAVSIYPWHTPMRSRCTAETHSEHGRDALRNTAEAHAHAHEEWERTGGAGGSPSTEPLSTEPLG